MASDSESDLTDLSDEQVTPGVPTTPGHASTEPAQQGTDEVDDGPSSSSSPRRSSTYTKKGARAMKEASSDEGAGTGKDPSPEVSSKKRSIKVKPFSKPQEKSGDAGDEAGPSQEGKSAKAVKIKMAKKKASLSQAASPEGAKAETKPSTANGASFAKELKDLGDADADEDSDAELSSAHEDRDEEFEDSGVAVKRKRGSSSDGGAISKRKKPIRNTGRRTRRGGDEPLLAGVEDSDDDDEDEPMEDASDSSEEVGNKRKKAGKAKGTKQSQEGQPASAANKTVKSKATGNAKDATKGSAGTGVKGKSSKAEPSSVLEIRPSAGIASAAANKPTGSDGGSATSSPMPPRKGMNAVGASAMQPRPRPPQPKPKPRGPDMWGSLVGSSKPSGPRPPPRPTPEEEAAKVAAAEQEKAKQAASAGPGRPETSSTPALPRPLGTSSNLSSSFSRDNRPLSGAANRPPTQQQQQQQQSAAATSQHSFVVHMTPGLNGQHWDKEAYRRMRLIEKNAYRHPDRSSLLNLMEDAEAVQSFEEEWRRLRVEDRVRHPGLKYREYGAGVEYAKVLREEKQKQKVEEEAQRKGREEGAAVAPAVSTGTVG